MDFDPNSILDQMEEEMLGGNIYLPYEARQAAGCVPEHPQIYQYRSAQPSPLSSSRRGASDVSPMIAISTGDQRTSNSSNRRNIVPLQDDFPAFPDDVEITGVISPHVDEDVSYVQRRFSFSEIPDPNSILDHEFQPYVLEDVLQRNRNNASSPWNALGTEGLYGGGYQAHQDLSLLTVPGYSQSQTQTMEDELSPAASTTGWLSDMSPDNGDMRHEARPRARGGRQPGSNLPEESVDNVRRVRRIGACLRCAALKERCSPNMPCSSCAHNDGRKWDGCVRSFTSLIDIFKPELLATRLESEAITRFMIDNTNRRRQPVFDLPLDFGFGKDFYGFQGAEYDPITMETQYSHAVGYTEQHPESPLYGYSIQVYPTNSGSPEVMKLVYKWLKETLTSTQSMEDWLRICFHGEDVEWIRHLLRIAWHYSIQSWSEQNYRQTNEPQLDESQLDKDLLSAWMVALLTTMLSLPITIATSARQGILNQLQSARPNYECSYSSRPINKCVKSLFFEIYKRLIKKVMLALEAFKKKAPKDISERHLGHVHCMAILVVVITWQLQTSLMDNYRLAAQDNAGLDETFDHIRGVEQAFKNTVLYIRHKNRDWFKLHLPRNGSRDDEAQVITPRLQGIINIKLDYSEEISRHRTAKLESVMDVNLPFNHLNMQRVFAFYFDPIPATR